MRTVTSLRKKPGTLWKLGRDVKGTRMEGKGFAVDLLKDRVARGSFERGEYYSQKNVLVREKNRKDRGIRQSFKRNHRKAPQVP